MARMQLCMALAENDIRLLAMERHALRVRELLVAHRPDLLVVDTELVQLDGPHLAMQLLRDRSLPVQPAVVLLYSPEMCMPYHAELESLGAALAPKPLNGAGLRFALQRLRPAPVPFSQKELDRADRLLDWLGMPPHVGRDCLRLAVLMCAQDDRLCRSMSARLYPAVGAQLKLSPESVEQAMRHAIDLAWQSYSSSENQYHIFGNTIDAERGIPTCQEMISRLADILRLEG